jgi:bacterioferritin-associated ferredoxin
MYVCHCRAVSDRVIRAVIADGVAHMEDLATRCGAGSRCGGCRPALQALLDERVRHCGDGVDACQAVA